MFKKPIVRWLSVLLIVIAVIATLLIGKLARKVNPAAA